jgi:hypothetical protein
LRVRRPILVVVLNAWVAFSAASIFRRGLLIALSV